jgi:hypothetical protein
MALQTPDVCVILAAYTCPAGAAYKKRDFRRDLVNDRAMSVQSGEDRAEWKGTGVEEDRHNSTRDVMLHHPDVEQLLLQPPDVLKMAYHGSHNGPPFTRAVRRRS